jgi:hypothetical protein
MALKKLPLRARALPGGGELVESRGFSLSSLLFLFEWKSGGCV